LSLISGNPASGTLAVRYQTPVSGNITLSVYNLAGQLVKKLAGNSTAKGSHVAIWDGRNSKGQKALSGIYLVRMETKGFTKTLKAVCVQ
jgi:fibronectin-binding autotransporter adhesin